jgi:predicted Fe-S protein YdhL (DUF1289 family)
MDTPCVQVCVVDDVTGFCIGCGRSRHEVASWSSLSGEQRRSVHEALPGRLRTMTVRSVRGRRRRRSPGGA